MSAFLIVMAWFSGAFAILALAEGSRQSHGPVPYWPLWLAVSGVSGGAAIVAAVQP